MRGIARIAPAVDNERSKRAARADRAGTTYSLHFLVALRTRFSFEAPPPSNPFHSQCPAIVSTLDMGFSIVLFYCKGTQLLSHSLVSFLPLLFSLSFSFLRHSRLSSMSRSED
jgi:hypothetical protein